MKLNRWVGVAAWLGVLLSLSSPLVSLVAQDLGDLQVGAIPLAVGAEPTWSTVSGAHWREESARRALQAGVYDVAADLAATAVQRSLATGVYEPLGLVALDALLARERWVEALGLLEALGAMSGAPRPALALRRAMISFAEANSEAVARRLEGISVEDLDGLERPWLEFLRGWVAMKADDSERARLAFEAARASASEQSPALAAQIGFLVFRSQLEARAVGAETIPQLQSAALENRGRSVGYAYAQQLAVAMHDSGDVAGAIGLIERELASLAPERLLERAQFQLLQVLAAGLERVEGRQAFQDLISSDRFPDLMSMGLQQAFGRARMEGQAGRMLISSVLDKVIGQSAQHSLLDQALYYRAVFKFLDEDFVGAEEDAATFQASFPYSPFRRGVLALQASAAWNRSRFRTAASYLRQMQRDFVDLRDSVELSALVADCHLRAGLQSNTAEDFRNAAESYASALSGVSNAAQGGPLFFQLVLARLRSGQIDQAVAVLDNPELRRLAGSEMLWRSEWMLVKEMRQVGRVSDGYDRVRVAIALADADPSLRLRLLWQAVKLSLESGAPEDTEYWVDQVTEFAEGDAAAVLDREQVKMVMGSCLLALAESLVVLDEPEAAVALLERLRVEYAGSESALLSYVAQARYFSSIDQTVDAQRLLVSLADNFPDNRLAPMALYEAAVNAERRGEDAYLDQANKLLQRIANDYPESEMVYYARLKQADLLRKLNQFGSAERIYAFLETEYASRPDRYLAQMSLANTLIAQSVLTPSKFAEAVSRLELLMDLPEAPLGLRVEAGYTLGQAWRANGEVGKAKQTFWLLYDLSVADEPRFRALTRKGRYWLARSLFALAEISKEEGKLDESDQFYERIVELGLWGSELAKARLDMLEPVGALEN